MSGCVCGLILSCLPCVPWAKLCSCPLVCLAGNNYTARSEISPYLRPLRYLCVTGSIPPLPVGHLLQRQLTQWLAEVVRQDFDQQGVVLALG